MAARRLVIVMLVLLGISTLAAALLPSRSPRSASTSTATETNESTTASTPVPAVARPTKITIGAGKIPVVSPVPVGQRLSLAVFSRFPTQVSIPAFGQLGYATSNAPALFQLLPERPSTYGILLAPQNEVAAQIRVVTRKDAR
jgi:hypothetical protein